MLILLLPYMGKLLEHIMEPVGYQKSGKEDAHFIISLKCSLKNLYGSLLK